jgi:hypothetical protein
MLCDELEFEFIPVWELFILVLVFILYYLTINIIYSYLIFILLMLKEKSDSDNANVAIELYKNNKYFQDSVRRKYNIKDAGILYDDKILLLIYALEWFDIPEKKYYYKVCYHPYLTRKDLNHLNTIYENQKNNFFITTLGVYAGLFFFRKKFIGTKGSNLRKNWKPIFYMFFVSLLFPILSWELFFVSKLNQDIKEDKDLADKYFHLDVDKKKIKRDLLNFNIVL